MENLLISPLFYRYISYFFLAMAVIYGVSNLVPAVGLGKGRGKGRAKRGQVPVDLGANRSVEELSQAIDQTEGYDHNHTESIAELAVAIGEQYGLSGEDIEHLRTAGLLHDIGFLTQDASYLQKTEPLTPEDWKGIWEHPLQGEEQSSTI